MYDNQTNHLWNRIASNIDSTNISTVYSWHQRTFRMAALLGHISQGHFDQRKLTPEEPTYCHLSFRKMFNYVTNHLFEEKSCENKFIYGWVATLWRCIKYYQVKSRSDWRSFPKFEPSFPRKFFFWGCYKWSSNCSANRVLEAQGRHIFLSSGRQQGNFYTGRKSAEKPKQNWPCMRPKHHIPITMTLFMFGTWNLGFAWFKPWKPIEKPAVWPPVTTIPPDSKCGVDAPSNRTDKRMLWRWSTARRTCGNLSSAEDREHLAQVVGEINQMAKDYTENAYQEKFGPCFQWGNDVFFH